MWDFLLTFLQDQKIVHDKFIGDKNSYFETFRRRLDYVQNCDADLGHVTQMLDTLFCIEGGILWNRFVSKGANRLFLTICSQNFSPIGRVVAELCPFS